jgi:hypothetical protein
MRRPFILTVVLAALVVASVAYAKTTGTANISSELSSAGISGTADFSMIGSGAVKVHESLSGLTPGVQYVSRIFSNSTTCGAGGTTALINTFTSNAQGKANFTVVAPVQVSPLDGFSSVSVQRVSDNALLGCGPIVTQ